MADIFPAISLALTIIDKIQAFYQESSATEPDDVGQCRSLLNEIQALLEDVKKSDSNSRLAQQLIENVENLAYEIEDAVADYLRHITHSGDKRGLRGLAQNMQKKLMSFVPGNEVEKATRKFKKNMVDINNLKGSFCKLEGFILSGVSSIPRNDSTDKLDYLASGVDVVGFATRNRQLFKQFSEETDERIILITGPGGSGKSTFMKDIYESSQRDKIFSCQDWIIDKLDEELAKQLLKMLEENDPREEQSQLQRGRKFLLVLDNVWEKEGLEIMKTLLVPKLSEGSRIIIISRRSDMLLSSGYIHDLSSGLSDKDAGILFKRKAFRRSDNEAVPSTMRYWADKMLEMCEGMPLAISTIGDSLHSKAPIPADWKDLYEKLGSEIYKDIGTSELHVLFRNLEKSYTKIQIQWISCLLYFSLFPHGRSISRNMLIRLWVAEGFVGSEIRQTAEKIAEDILDNLITRNLVVAKAMEVDGRVVEGYRVLHLVREINIARGEKFLTVLDPHCKRLCEKIRRISVIEGAVKEIEGRTAALRTLLVFDLAKVSSDSSILLRKILKSSKFLRVLDLEGLKTLDEFPPEVSGLTLLKYLSLKETQVGEVPKSIKKLVNLETLDLRQTNVTSLPSQICYLLNLRHLLVFCKNVRNGGVDLSSADIGALSYLQTLSCIKVGDNTDILTVLSKLTSLRELRLTDIQTQDGADLWNSVRELQNLSTLDVSAATVERNPEMDDMPEYLRCLHIEGRLADVPNWIPRLTSLTKITLKWSKLSHVSDVNPLEPLQVLESLKELDLVDYCSGPQLVFVTGTFEKLSVLRMEQFDQLKTMIIENLALPKLKELTMRRCRNLEVLPEGIDSLTLLEKIKCSEMHDMFKTRLKDHYQEKKWVKLDLA